ncbi:MAG: Flp pilus assembly complex ATPase component TadA [Sedimentisphaerales bacterium]|nr:Flp pilus assembly complex ATPase component TadA [Sedimentisphaerales bacterium]
MSESVLIASLFGEYISIVKFVILLVLFFPWLALLSWIYEDARAVGLDERRWVGIILTIGAVFFALWLLIPVFIVGLLLYAIGVGAAALIYVMQRNAKVPDFEKVLTPDHIMGLFSNPDKKLDKYESLSFISANNNEIPVPETKTPEFFGFKAAHDLFSDAIYRRTSDIVLSPAGDSYRMTYIVDGTTLKQPELSKEQVESLSFFLKQLAGLNLEERRKPQKGHFRTTQEQGSCKWEITTAGSTAGEQLRIKQITQSSIYKLAEINLTDGQYKQLNSIRDMKQGLFLITGPRQSGVTTTFYAFLRNHDAFLNVINALEIRPSGELPNVTQEVYSLSDSGTTTYAKKLLSMVRMSPDVLGAADVKDTDTAQIVTKAAKDGVIVYATIEADSTTNALAKWIKLVGDRKAIAETLVGISNQRLFRTLCSECKQAYEPNKELFRKYNIPPGKARVLYRAGKVVYDKRGKAYPCEHCQEIGYYGRTCVFETVMINNELKKAIIESKSHQDLAIQMRKNKVKYLQEQMLDKVLEGATSIDEMIKMLSEQRQGRQRTV